MKYASLLALTIVICAVPAALIRASGDDAQDKSKPGKTSQQKNKPLRLSDDKPLLLLDDEGNMDEIEGADNSRCQVCHLNLAMEELAMTHAKADIGCADCHGDCDAHIDDESWATGGPGTPPGIMFPPESIDEACEKCHDTHDVPAIDVLERWKLRCPDKKDLSKVVCTDCHGKHRLNPKLRKAWWDKKTRQPIRQSKETIDTPIP